MAFARHMMRIAGAVLLVFMILFAMNTCALCEENEQVIFSIQATPDSLTAPGEISVSLKVSNPSGKDMVDPVTLYDPAGNIVPGFGDGGSYVLKSGDSVSWEGKWNVTQAQLDKGEVEYSLKYHVEDEAGRLAAVTRQAVARIQFTGEKVSLKIERKISPEVVRSGAQATVTYDLYNDGNVELTDIRVQEKISKTAKSVKSLPAGQHQTVTFTSRIGNADLKSSAVITYKAAGTTKTLTENVSEATIPLAKPNLKIELSGPENGVNVGQPAVLTITFTNSGNVSYSKVSVSEVKKGEILTNLSIPAGATVVEQKEFILNEPTNFKVAATLPDNTGETKTLSSNEIRVGVFDPEKQLLLTLNLTSDQETVSQVPADVRFHLKVTNNSNVKAEKISIYHGSTFIYTIAALKAGESVTLDRDVRISQAGQFRFTASVKDSLNNTVTFDSNTIRLAYARPTAAPTVVPVVTVAPPVLVTPVPSDPLMSQGRSALLTAGMALAALFACALLLFIVSSIARARKKSKSNAAYDHLDLAERRDYTEPSDGEFMDEMEGPEIVEASRDDGEEKAMLPHEKALHSAAQTDAADAPALEDLPATDGEGGYRVSRTASRQEAPAEEKPVVSEQKADAPDESVQAQPAEETPRRRHRRSGRTEDGE